MANSVTLNVILSNYMVNLAYAIDCIENPLYGENTDSYFKLVRDLDETNNNLDDQTRLVLDVANGDGTFKTRDLVLEMKELWNQSQNVKEFFNLDSIWYCKKVESNMDGTEHDTIAIVYEMNNFVRYPNPFGENPFDHKIVGKNISFNDWIGSLREPKLNCIIENRFYKNVFQDDGAVGPGIKFSGMISRSKYLLCVPGGFYGLESTWDDNGAFAGFKMHDIGGVLPILGKAFDFKFCSFHVIGDSDEITLFLVVQEKDTGKYHYLYLNESSIDETYGFNEIDSVVVDQLIVPPSDVFSKVESIRELDTVNIALTDYGFWDIEKNQTNNTTYSYRNGKAYVNNLEKFNGDKTKLIDPTISIETTTKYCEYSHVDDEDSDENYGIDRLWKENGEDWYYCHDLVVDASKPESDILHRFKNYRSSIVGDNGNTISLFECTENFALYNSSTTSTT